MSYTHSQYVSVNSRNLKSRLKMKYNMAKVHATERNITFTLTFQDFVDMWTAQRGLCAYTNQRMTITVGRGLYWRNWSVSIDRLDPTQPYTKENCLLVRYDANRIKGRRSFFSVAFLEDFSDFVANALKVRPELQLA